MLQQTFAYVDMSFMQPFWKQNPWRDFRSWLPYDGFAGRPSLGVLSPDDGASRSAPVFDAEPMLNRCWGSSSATENLSDPVGPRVSLVGSATQGLGGSSELIPQPMNRRFWFLDVFWFGNGCTVIDADLQAQIMFFLIISQKQICIFSFSKTSVCVSEKNPHGFRLAVAEPIATNVARSAMQWWAQKQEFFFWGAQSVFPPWISYNIIISDYYIYIHITVTYWWWYSDTQFCFSQSIGVKIKWWIFLPVIFTAIFCAASPNFTFWFFCADFFHQWTWSTVDAAFSLLRSARSLLA